MSNIEKRGEGRAAVYVARWRTPTGKSRQRTFNRERDAKAHLDEVGGELRSGKYVDSLSEAQTFLTWHEGWTAHRVNVKDSTVAKTDSLARTHLLPEFGHVSLGEISQPQVQAWVHGLHTSGLAPATTHAAFQLLSKSLRTAVAAGQLRQSPCIGVEVPRIESEDMRFLDHREVATLAATIPERYEALVLLLAYGGLRIGEATGLRRHRVNLLRGTVTVATTASEVRGRWVETTPKTAAARRTVPLPAPVVDALRNHIENYSQPESDGLVFTSPEGGPLRVASWRQRVWGPAVKAAGLDPLRIHDLRHTAVSLWISGGVDLLRIKKWAGHTRSTFTLDRYGHLYEDDDAALVGDLAKKMQQHQDADIVPLRVASVLDG